MSHSLSLSAHCPSVVFCICSQCMRYRLPIKINKNIIKTASWPDFSLMMAEEDADL